jgi:hypothetical protein
MLDTRRDFTLSIPGRTAAIFADSNDPPAAVAAFLFTLAGGKHP